MGVQVEKWIVLFHYLPNRRKYSYPIMLFQDRIDNT